MANEKTKRQNTNVILGRSARRKGVEIWQKTRRFGASGVFTERTRDVENGLGT